MILSVVLMCGLCGVLAFDESTTTRGTLESMTHAIAHRGPDGEGHYLKGPVALGHRRLAVIDLSDAGRQPMSTSDKGYVIAFNGEIYNHGALRVELESLGHRFVSRTDTEVVLKSWVQWGSGSIKRFNGMFAFAIWNDRNQELSLVRDRYGAKPLYYADLGNLLVFGSEQRAIIEHPLVGKRLDRIALVEYLTFQNILSDRTFNSDIKTLPAGHTLVASCRPRKLRLTKYWDFQFVDSNPTADAQELDEELERLIRQAVRRQLQTDVELGAYLSGGLDSSTLVTLASTEVPALKTFTCGFDTTASEGAEIHYDEREAARELSVSLGTVHSEIVVGQSDLDNWIDTVAQQLEEPRVGQSYPNFLVANHASKTAKVVLSGTGGDELFAGYPWRYVAAFRSRNETEFRANYFREWNRLLPRSQFADLLAPIWSSVKDFDTRQLFDSIMARHEKADDGKIRYVNDCLYFEAKTFLHGLLIVEDKLSMAHGLESRVPYLDNDLVEFAMNCPVSQKLQPFFELVRQSGRHSDKSSNSEPRTLVGKVILRRVLGGIAGVSVATRPKQGFAAPDSRWLAESLEYMLSDAHNFASLEGILSRHALIEMLRQQRDSGINLRAIAWSLLSLRSLLTNYEL